jgi:predicted transcriptional regulator
MTSDEQFDSIRERLVEEELVFKLRGENNSPYLSLTDKGVAIINRLYEIERIIEGYDVEVE